VAEVNVQMPNRFFAAWFPAERRAILGQCVGLAGIAIAVISQVNLRHEQTKDPIVIRSHRDGMPQAIALDFDAYQEPDEVEMRWFGMDFASRFMQGDSYSVRQDFLYCAQRMVPEKSEQFIKEAKGSKERPGAVFVIESLKRRTDIPRESLQVEVDKRPWPWRITVRGERRVLGDETSTKKWELMLEVVKASRRIVPAGLLVYDLRSAGGPVIGPSLTSVVYGKAE
jgi:hypothetical protein